MDNTVSVIFGKPHHGWLPVSFHYKEFQLDFEASDVLNDPIEEVCALVAELKDNECKRITWWLEPAAYFFDVVRKGSSYSLAIIETEDLHNEQAAKTQLISITGEFNEIMEPFRMAVKHFAAQTFDEMHWPYKYEMDNLG